MVPYGLMQTMTVLKVRQNLSYLGGLCFLTSISTGNYPATNPLYYLGWMEIIPLLIFCLTLIRSLKAYPTNGSKPIRKVIQRTKWHQHGAFPLAALCINPRGLIILATTLSIRRDNTFQLSNQPINPIWVRRASDLSPSNIMDQTESIRAKFLFLKVAVP